MILVTFALPDESRDFLARLKNRKVFGEKRDALKMVVGELHGRLLTVVHTGVGKDAGKSLHSGGPGGSAVGVRWVIAAGYAGALQPGLRVGDIVLGENFSAPHALAVARSALGPGRVSCGLFSTQPAAIESAAEKAALHAKTGALAVDMETEWIAAACARTGVPMLSLRVVSDAADQDFPVPGAVMFDAVRQRPRYLALPAYLLTHPARIPPFVRFVRGLAPARARLAEGLERVIEAMTNDQ